MSEAETARAVVVTLALVGAEWTATSAQLPGLRVYGASREGAERVVRARLGPAAEVEFLEVEPPSAL